MHPGPVILGGSATHSHTLLASRGRAEKTAKFVNWMEGSAADAAKCIGVLPVTESTRCHHEACVKAKQSRILGRGEAKL